MKKSVKNEKVKEKVNYYLEIPYIYKDYIQEMFYIKWDKEKHQWFTNREWEVQDIEEKIEKLKEYARNSFDGRLDMIEKYIDFILYILPPNTEKRQEIVKELYQNPGECLRILRRDSLQEKQKKICQKTKILTKKKTNLRIIS